METTSSPKPSHDEIRRRVVRGSLLFVITRSAVAGFGFLASLFLYRLLGPEEAGKFQLLIAVTSTAGTALSLGLYETLARFVPERSPQEGAGLFRKGLRFNTYAVLVATALVSGLVAAGVDFPPEVLVAPAAVAAAAVAYAFQGSTLGMLRGQGRLGAIPWLEMGRNFGGRLAALAVAAIFAAGFAPAFRSFALVQVVVVGVTFILLRHSLTSGEQRFSPTETGVARLLWISEMLGILILVADIYILRILMEPHAVGIYAAGVRPTRIGKQLVLGPLIVPLLYYFSHPESAYLKERIVVHGTRLAGVIMGFVGLVLVLLAEPLVNFILGPRFAESVPVLKIYVAYAMGHSMTMFMIPFFNSINRPQYGIYQKLLTLVLSAVLAVVLVPRYGVTGAAVGGVLGISITILLTGLFLRARYSMGILWPVSRLFALYGACFWLAREGYPIPALAAYAAALFPLGLIRAKDIDLVRSLRRGRREKTATPT